MKVLFLILSSLLLSCTAEDSSTEIENNSFGLRIIEISGSGQIGPPDQLFETPAKIQIIDNSGRGVEGIPVQFSEQGNSGMFITQTQVFTDANGYGQTNVRSPTVFDRTGIMLACIAGSATCVEMNFSSDNTSEQIEYQLLTQNSFNETAGVPFTLTVQTVDTNSKEIIPYDGTQTLTWLFVTSNSWTGQTPTILPASLACTFVDGICNVTQPVTLVDTSSISQVYVGDGDGGFIDFPLTPITVNPGAPAAIQITDATGGPSNSANVILNTQYSVDDAPVTFYAAITDSTGNYISDAATANWSSTRPTEITSNLTTLTGPSTTLVFNQSIPIPNFGRITADVATYPTGTTGDIYIYPGTPVDAQIVPTTAIPPHALYTQLGGDPFEFDIEIYDSKGNIVDSQLGGVGFSGTFNVTFTFSNYQSGPQVSGGDLPMIHNVNSIDATATTIVKPLSFFDGRTNLSNERITFFDATSVNPTVDISIDTSLEPLFPNVTGQTIFNMVVGPPDHLMLKDAAGPTGNSLCVADYTNAFSFLWERLPDILMTNYQSSLKETCSGLELTSDDPARNLFLTVEDKGGNFIADINGDWVTTDPVLGDSNFDSLLSGSNTNSSQMLLSPNITTNGLPSNEYIRLQATYNTVNYDQYLRGTVGDGTIDSIELRILTRNFMMDNEAPAHRAQTLIVVPKDSQGNELTNNFFADLRLSIVSGSFNNAPDGTPPIFPIVGDHNSKQFTVHTPFSAVDNLNDTTVVAEFTGLVTPNAGDVVRIRVEDINNAAIFDEIDWTVIPGDVTRAEIWKDNLPGMGGTNVTSTNFSMTADESTNFFIVTYDTYDNDRPINSSWVTWHDTPQPFTPGSVSGIIASTMQTPFVVDTPGSGILAVDASSPGNGSASAQTGTITLLPGTPSSIEVAVDSSNFVAGTDRDVTVRVKDAKNNTVTGVTGATDLAINILTNSPTRLGFDHTAPGNGNYNFTAGEHIFNTGDFKFYNASEIPRIQVTSTISGGIVGNSPLLTVTPAAFDHLALLSANTQLLVGNTNRYTIRSEDAYGNKLNSGPDSTKTVDFTITSALGDEDITGSDLSSATITNFTPLNQKTITGDLTNGEAYVDVYGEVAGTLTVDGNTTGGNMGNNTEDPFSYLPLTAISGIRFKPGQEPPNNVSAVFPINSFAVEILDSLGNVITTNNTAQIQLSIVSGNSNLNGTTIDTVSSGEANFSGLTYTLAETIDLRATVVGQPAIFIDKTITVDLGNATRTVVILPDQTWTEGTGSLGAAITGPAFSGTNTRTAGDSFNVTLRAVDASYNTRTDYIGPVSVVSTDPYLETLGGDTNFTAGVATINVRVRQKGLAQNITASTGLPSNDSSTNYVVNVGTVTQLAVLMPGQSLNEGAPDLATALDLLIPNQTAGVALTAQVLALDAYYNNDTTYTHPDVALALNADPVAPAPANQAMTGGSINFSVTHYRATVGHTLTASTPSGPVLTGQTSEAYEVKEGAASQYIAIFPGQSHVAGQAPGNYAGAVINPPTDQDTDNGFSVVLKAVDNYFNTRTDYTGAVSIDTPSDPNDTPPAGSNFTAGIVAFTINPVKAADGQSITVTAPGLAANAPANYNVKPGAPAKLIAVFGDYQTYSEGGSNFTTVVTPQTTATRTSNEVVAVTVYATDNLFNVVDDDTTSVTLNPTVAASNINIAPASATLNNGSATFNIQTYLVGTSFNVIPNGAGYSGTPSTSYDVDFGPSLQLLHILPGQTFVEGQANATLAASNNPFHQTQGASFPFTVDVYAVDDYFNHRTTVTETVTLTPSVAHVVAGGNSTPMVGGVASFTLHHTANGNSASISSTATGGYGGSTSKNYNVLAPLTDPTLALSDPNTGSTTHVRQVATNTAVTEAATVYRWCLSESQNTRPSTGTNNRQVCTGGSGTDNGWLTAQPTSFNLANSQGSHTLYLWVADLADNVSLGNINDSITLDSILPNDPAGLVLSDQSTTSTGYTDVALVDLDVTLSGDTTEWCIIEQNFIAAPPSAPTFFDACWAAKPGVFPTTYTVQATGNRAVYVFAKDVADNVSSSYSSASIFYDDTAPIFPVGNDILGARGNLDTIANAFLGTTLEPTIEWQAAADSTTVTYDVTIKLTGTPQCGGTQSTTSTSYTFTGCNLVHGNTYTIELTATDQANQTTVADNNGMSFIVDNVAPGTPTISGVSGGADVTTDTFLTDALSAPNLHWVDTTGEDGYRVAITTMGDVDFCGADTTAANASNYNSFTGCNLVDNTSYKITVVAYDSAGNESAAVPLTFRATRGADNFLVELVPASNPVAGANFSVKLTARRANGTTSTTYTGLKTINWTNTGSTGVDVCTVGPNLNPEMGATSVNFTAGIATIPNFKMKVAETGRTVTATETDTAYNATGTSSTFDVTATATGCIRFETLAGGAGLAHPGGATAIDTRLVVHAAGRDIYGNFVADQSVTWSGTGSLAQVPFPTSGTSTVIVGVESGLGQLIATGAFSDNMNFNFGVGATTLTTVSTDGEGSNHLSNNNNNSVFHWNVMADSVNGWRTAGTQSWHGEASALNDRSSRDDFPQRVHLVASNSGLDIIDAMNNDLYMRFQTSSNYAVDSDLGVIVDVTALNGKIYLSMNSGATGGLIIIDLENDEVYQINSTSRLISGNNIANRNAAATWSADTTFPLLSGDQLNKIVSRRVGGQDYVAFGHDSGADILKTTGATALSSDATTNPVYAIDMDSTGKLYYSEDSVGLHRSDTPLSGGFTPSRTYTTSTAGELADTDLNDISVAEGTSSAQAGQSSLVIGSALGLTVIQEHSVASSSTSKTYSTLGTGENPFAGNLSFLGTNGYVNIPDGGSLTDTATIEFWFKPAGAVANTTLFDKGNTVDGSLNIRFNGSGNLEFNVVHNTTTYTVSSSSNTWNLNQWYHVAAIVDGGGNSIEMWIDGADHQSNTTMDFSVPSAFGIANQPITIGGLAASQFFNGFIDEMRIMRNTQYSGASFTVPTTAFSNNGNTVHLFHFNEFTGTTTYYSDNDAQENGTLNGDILFSQPLFNGNSESINNVDSTTSGASVSAQFTTSSGWHDYVDLQSSPYRQDDQLGIDANDIKIIHKTSTTDNDALIGLTSGGLRLDRR